MATLEVERIRAVAAAMGTPMTGSPDSHRDYPGVPGFPDTPLLRHRDFGIHASTSPAIGPWFALWGSVCVRSGGWDPAGYRRGSHVDAVRAGISRWAAPAASGFRRPWINRPCLNRRGLKIAGDRRGSWGQDQFAFAAAGGTPPAIGAVLGAVVSAQRGAGGDQTLGYRRLRGHGFIRGYAGPAQAYIDGWEFSRQPPGQLAQHRLLTEAVA